MPLTSIPAYKNTPSRRVSITLVFRAAFLLGVICLTGYAALMILLG